MNDDDWARVIFLGGIGLGFGVGINNWLVIGLACAICLSMAYLHDKEMEMRK